MAGKLPFRVVAARGVRVPRLMAAVPSRRVRLMASDGVPGDARRPGEVGPPGSVGLAERRTDAEDDPAERHEACDRSDPASGGEVRCLVQET